MATTYKQVYNPLSWNFENVPVAWTEAWDFVVIEETWEISEEVLPETVSKYSDSEPVEKTWTSVTIWEKDFLINFVPTGDFTINKWDVAQWITYILRTTPNSSYTITLWSWITNPYEEDLTLTSWATTTIIFLAVDDWLEIQSVRTFASVTVK